MGAEYSQFKARCTREELRPTFVEFQEQCFYDHGHSGYTGTMAEADGCSITTKEFITNEEAEEWLTEHAEKWGPALVVKVTLNDQEPYWLFGAWCSS